MATTPKPEKLEKSRGAKGEGCLFKRGRFYTYKAPDGARYATGTQIKSEAVDFKLRKLAELRSDQPHIVSKAKGTTLNELLDAYLASMRRDGAKTAAGVEGILKLHVRPAFGHRVASTLTTADFHKYRINKFSPEDRLGHTSINRHFAYIRAAFYVGQKLTPALVERVPYFPMDGGAESANVRQGFLEHEGYLKVLAHLPASLKPLFVCGYHLGNRCGELKNLKWSQVDLENETIILRPQDTKNGRGRVLPIYGDMVRVLKTQKKLRDLNFPDCGHVFFWHNEETFTLDLAGKHIQQFRKQWKRAVKDAGYPGLLFHDLRRSATRNMKKGGVDQADRMQITGHVTPSQDLRYNIVVADDVADQKTKLEAFFKSESAKAAKKEKGRTRKTG